MSRKTLIELACMAQDQFSLEDLEDHAAKRNRFLGRVVNAGKEREWGEKLWDYAEANGVDPELLLSTVLRGERAPPDGFLLWCRYLVETEEFDRSVCPFRHPKTGDAVPVEHEERRLCSENAHRVRRRLGLDATMPGRKQAMQLTLEGARAMLGLKS